jgi:glycosyltransferase involved in cell wall biosynthesis
MIDTVEIDSDNDIGEYIGYAGRISPEKGVPVFLGAARNCENIPFKLAGDYQRIPNIPQTATENVEFLGNLGKEKLFEFYKNCRMLVMPSLWYEGFPGVILEAMAHGRPVVCSRIGGLPEIVEDGKTGLLFEPGNPDDLVEKIQYLWERPEISIQMGNEGRKKVLKEYSQEKYYSRLMKVYEKAISIKSGSN